MVVTTKGLVLTGSKNIEGCLFKGNSSLSLTSSDRNKGVGQKGELLSLMSRILQMRLKMGHFSLTSDKD